MADGGLIGNGIKIGHRVDASPLGAYVTLGQILSINDFVFERDAIDSTVSSTNIFKRSLPGMAQVTDIEIELLANPDEADGQGIVQDDLIDLLESGETRNWLIEVPVDRAQTEFRGYNFDGYVRTFSHMKPIMDRQVFKFAIAFDDDDFERIATGAGTLS